jgi:hypothetical protein
MSDCQQRRARFSCHVKRHPELTPHSTNESAIIHISQYNRRMSLSLPSRTKRDGDIPPCIRQRPFGVAADRQWPAPSPRAGTQHQMRSDVLIPSQLPAAPIAH